MLKEQDLCCREIAGDSRASQPTGGSCAVGSLPSSCLRCITTERSVAAAPLKVLLISSNVRGDKSL